ncbi:MAG: NYN domain-containing protein [Gemmatimonadota bacterium]
MKTDTYVRNDKREVMNDNYPAVPHMPANQQPRSHNAALLIDFDNVTMAIRSNLAVELRKLLDSDIIRGKVSVQRAYADWRRYPQYVVPLSEASIDLIFAPAYGSTKKNSTDIRLAIDALEIVFTRPEIGTFILLSGDSDFSSMVLKLKEYGKYVIGVGLQESASDLLIQNCDEYYSYNSLSGLTSFADMERESLGPWELCERALERMVDRGDVMRSDRLKQVMVELDPSFDEKSIGFTKYNKYLSEASSRGLITLRKLENGQFEVGVPAHKPASSGHGAIAYADRSAPAAVQPEAAPPAPRRSRGGRGRGRSKRHAEAETGGATSEAAKPSGGEPAEADATSERRPAQGPRSGFGLREAYSLLRDAVSSLSRGDRGVRDSEVKREMLKQRPGFDEAELGFSKFTRFLKQAHDEEIVNVKQGEDGNFQIVPLESAGDGRKADRGRRGRKEHSDGPGTEQAGPAAEPVESTEPEPEAAEATGRAGADRRRGLRQRRGRRGGGKPDAQTSPEPGPSKEPEADDEPAAPAQAALDLEARPEPKPEPEPRPKAETRAAPKQAGLSRFRRGGRGGRGRGPGAAPSQAKTAEIVTPDSPEPETVEISDAPAPQTAEGPPGTAEVTPGTESHAAGDVVEHMVRNYKGVGRKTAETLAAELGTDVFDVIDKDPDRIRSILPGRRADAVIAGRAAEGG